MHKHGFNETSKKVYVHTLVTKLQLTMIFGSYLAQTTHFSILLLSKVCNKRMEGGYLNFNDLAEHKL